MARTFAFALAKASSKVMSLLQTCSCLITLRQPPGFARRLARKGLVFTCVSVRMPMLGTRCGPPP
eukprot:8614969-Alexandrium_andersonii.AAC.1